ncbi:hypothetical protein PIB30_027387 [Stylosanthes scabra]|uniref:Uncharacterized protein n=1 Tax=Stylosanthes scabra TaxID=79078 RepID=A0ABU6UDB2_9FABA|nr:hypothetical protein [Stylosanthes scabra]
MVPAKWEYRGSNAITRRSRRDRSEEPVAVSRDVRFRWRRPVGIYNRPSHRLSTEPAGPVRVTPVLIHFQSFCLLGPSVRCITSIRRQQNMVMHDRIIPYIEAA